MADQRSYTGGNFKLDIDGFDVGYLKKVSGMGMTADIAENKLGPDNVTKKHVANIKWEPGKAEVGIGMGMGMYSWIKAAFDKAVLTKNGTLTAADFNHKAVSSLTFSNALINEVTVPKLSGDDKNGAYFTVGWQAETVRWAKGGGEDIRSKIGPKQKAWLCSNFRVEIGNLPCSRVASVDSFTWKCSTTPDQIGIFREPTYHPAAVTVPDIKLSISYGDYDAWAAAANAWFVGGKHLEGDEMTGQITFLGPDMKQELGAIELHNVGFKSFSYEDLEGASDKVKRFSPTLYVERMVFKITEYDA
jgi:T4-like virus tail tube protein gp19